MYEKERVKLLSPNTQMAYQIIVHEFMQIPPVTRAYISTCILTTLAVVIYF